MKARASMALALVLIWTLVALPTPALATPPEPLTIDVDMWLTGETSAAGTFEISGLFSDYGNDFGDASEVYFMAAGTTHGVKTLVGEAGTIVMRYQAKVTWTSETTGIAEGQWVIVSGTGAYENLHGVGDTYAELDFYGNPQLVATYTGTAHFD